MFGDLGRILKIASQVKTKLPAVKAKIEASRHTAEVGGGVVAATVDGKMALVEFRIDPSLLADGQTDAAMLEDLVKAAVASAQAKAAEFARQAMTELTGGEEVAGLNEMLGL